MPFIQDRSNSSSSEQDASGLEAPWSIVLDEEYAANGFPGSNEKPLSEQLEPIAVIGMGCRLPGDVDSPEGLWSLMMEHRTGRTPKVPESRFNIDAHFHPNNERPGSFNVLGGYFLNSSLKEFDPGLFNISPIEAMWLDPQQRKLLEVVYETFESSGTPLDKVAGTKTAVFVGSFTADYQQMSFKEPDFRHSYAATGVDPGIISNRISHVFNLSGPSITVNTACSSSVYAMHNACNALRNGECEGAVVGGTNLVLTVDQHMNTAKLGVLSDTSECHTFDACADGYGRADAVGAVYLKRLSDALRDGDPIRACIRSSAVNSNGKVPSVGITYPNREGQEEVIRHAYERGGRLNPKLTGYFELHGTGTPVGDPIEANAVALAMNSDRSTKEEPLNVGAVKTNIGHSEAASGLSAVIKACLTVEKGIIPPIYKLITPNPAIKWDDWKIRPVTKAIPFPSHLPVKRVSVNSFGYGGTNGHIIVEAVDSLVPGYRIRSHKPKSRGGFARKRPYLLPFSAHNRATLDRNFQAIADVAGKYDLHDLSHTLANHRSQLTSRGFAVCNKETIKNLLVDEGQHNVKYGEVKNASPALGMLFTGQGSQWPQMGAELMRYYPSFLERIRRLDAILGDLDDAPEWTLEDLLLEDAATSQVGQAEFSQPLCTAIQIALVDLLAQWGVVPTTTAGHSSGEIAAAYAAGIISSSHAIVAAFYRGKVVSNIKADGAMMAVGLGPLDVAKYLSNYQGEVCVACHNSPSLVTLSGDQSALKAIKTSLDADKVFARLVDTGGKAYHSPHMLAVSAEYEKQMRKAVEVIHSHIPTRPRCVMISSVTMEAIGPNTILDETYWSRNLTSPVLFTEAVEIIGSHPTLNIGLLMEIGPHSSFAGPVRQICTVNSFKGLTYIPTLVRNQSSAENLLSTAGNLFLQGYNLDMRRVTATEEIFPSGKLNLRQGSILVDLPNYQWNYSKTLWAEPRHSVEHRSPRFARHDLLGALLPGGSKLEPIWRNMLRIRDVPWLSSHSLGREAVFPAAGYFSMAIEAIRQIESMSVNPQLLESFILRDISIKKALVTPDNDDGIETIFSMRPSIFSEHEDKTTWWDFNVTSHDPSDGSWKEHCTGSIRANGRSRGETGRAEPVFPQRASGKSWNQGLREVGFDYGPGFQDMENVRFNGKTYEAAADTIVKQTAGTMQGESRHVLHPGCIDSCLQLIIVSIYAGNLNRMTCGAVPIQVDEVAIFVPTESQLDLAGSAFAWTGARGHRSFHSGCQLLADDGELLLDISGMRTVAYEAAVPQQALEPLKSQPYMTSTWKEDASFLGVGRKSRIPSVQHALELFTFKKSGLEVLQAASAAVMPFVDQEETNVTFAGSTDEPPEAIQTAFEQVTGYNYVNLKSLSDQNCSAATYDVVVAGKGTTGLDADLHGLRRLLKPNGSLLLLDDTRESSLVDFTIAGFTDAHVVSINGMPSTIARADGAQDQVALDAKSSAFTFVYRHEPSKLAREIIAACSTNADVHVEKLTSYRLKEDGHIIIVADLEDPLLRSMTAEELVKLQEIMQSGAKITWLTAGGIMQSKLPEHAMASGLARSLTSENVQLSLVTVDIDIGSTSTAEAVELVSMCITAHATSKETEYAIANGKIYISRITPENALNEVYGDAAADTTVQLVEDNTPIEGNVRNNEVVWTLENRKASLPSSHIEVQVLYGGLSRENIQVITGSDYPTTFSTEVTGVVTRVAQGVAHLSVGDRVVGFNAAHMGRFQMIPAHMVQSVTTRREDLERLAGMPLAYGRAIYGLIYLAKVQSGENVFILSPTGPAGLAAISVCKVLGARVTVVLESEEDAAGLVDQFAVSNDQVIYPSSGLLRRRMLERTGNKGPDVVFSCSAVSKALARECWRHISPQGRFVDFGRKDVLKRSAVDIVPLHVGAQYLSFDFVEMLQSASSVLADVLIDLVDMYETGKIAVLPSKNVVRLEDLHSAVSASKESFTTGKTIVSYSGTQSLAILRSRPELRFNSNGTYLLIGCLGGLGRSLTSWMLSRGARRFAFLSRSGADAESAAQLVQELRATGAHVDICRGDVANLADVERAVSSIASAHPICGVIHAAMVLRDGMFSSMSYANWQTSTSPKVRGALNLHKALQKTDLDFFLLTSSVSGTLGTPGQSNYAAGNAFLDNFARWRQLQGLPATSLVLPMVLGVGVVAQNPELEDALKRKGIYGIDEAHLLQSFEAAIFSKQTSAPTDQLIIGLDPSLLQKSINSEDTTDAFWLEDPRFEKLVYTTRKNSGAGAGAGSGDSIKSAVLTASTYPEAVDLVVAHFSEKIVRLLLLDESTIQPAVTSIADYGLDSMIGAELRNWIFKNYDLDIPFQQLLASSMTIKSFAEIVCKNLGLTAPEA